MGNDNGIGLSPSPWLPSGSPTIPLPSARLMPPTPALDFPPISADLNLGIPSPSYPGTIMSPSVTGFMVSAPPNASRINSLKASSSTPATSTAATNPLENFANDAGGYDPPSTTPTPGPDGKSSQTQQPQPPPVTSAAVIAAAVTAAAPRPPSIPVSSAPKRNPPTQIKQQPTVIGRKKSTVSAAQPPQQPPYAKYATSVPLPTSSVAMAAAGWAAGGRQRSAMGVMPSPPAINAFGATGTTPAPTSLPMMSIQGMDTVGAGRRLYATGVTNKDILATVNGAAVGKPLSPGDASAVAACKEKAARVGDEFARKRKLQMDTENKRNPKKIKMEKRPEEMTKEELKKKSYAHRLYLNRQSAAVSRVRRQAYVKFLEESLTDIEKAKCRQESQIGNLRDENLKLKAQLQQMQSGMLAGKQGLSSQAMGSTSSYQYGLSGQRSSRYSRRR